MRRHTRRLVPAFAVDQDPRTEASCAFAASRRRHLSRRSVELGSQSQVDGRTLAAERQKGLELGLGKAGQVRPVPAKQVGSTIRSAIADYGDTGTAQRLEVAEYGASRHLDPASEVRGALPAVILQLVMART